MNNNIIDFESDTYKRLRRNLLLQYYTFLSLLLIVLLLGSLHMQKADISADVLTQLQSFAVLLTLGSIPFVLKFFGQKTAQLLSCPDLMQRLRSYQKLSLFRYLILELVGLFNIVCFLISRNYSFLLCTGMIIVASFFCMPTKKRIRYDIQPDSEETES
jgi:hypothetical protein